MPYKKKNLPGGCENCFKSYSFHHLALKPLAQAACVWIHEIFYLATIYLMFTCKTMADLLKQTLPASDELGPLLNI